MNKILNNENADQDSDTEENHKSLGVSFQDEPELYTYEEEHSFLKTDSDIRLPLLHEENEKEKEETNIELKTTKIEMTPLKNEERFHKAVVHSLSDSSTGDDLTQIIIDSRDLAKDDDIFT